MEQTFGSIPPGTWFALAEPAMFPWGEAHPTLVKLAEPVNDELGIVATACGLCDGRLRAILDGDKVLPIVVQAPEAMASKGPRTEVDTKLQPWIFSPTADSM